MSASRPRILVSESAGFDPGAAAVLRDVGDLQLADLDRPGLLRAIPRADVLWVRLRHRIDAPVLDAAPRLRAIATPTTGLNHIDLEAAEAHDVRVVSLRGEAGFLRDVRATAEHTIGLMLALLRRLPAAHAHVVAGGWDRDRFRGRELHGATVGLVGLGRLGRIVAGYLTAFDARVLAADPYVAPGAGPAGVALVPLDVLLREADVVSVHAAYGPETHGLIGRRELALLREGAWLVNTARGELVDEDALLDALRDGRLAGAALDVLADEHAGPASAERPLVAYARAHDNLVLTPHVGGCTHESMAKTERFLAGRVASLLGAEQGG